MVIIFLDLDGVLHPFFLRGDLSDQENQLFGVLTRFESVIRAFPIARIVIASDCRKRQSLADLHEFFSPELRWLACCLQDISTVTNVRTV